MCTSQAVISEWQYAILYMCLLSMHSLLPVWPVMPHPPDMTANKYYNNLFYYPQLNHLTGEVSQENLLLSK